MASLGNRLLYREVNELVIYPADKALGLSCHGGVNRMGAEAGTVDGIIAVCRGGADDL